MVTQMIERQFELMEQEPVPELKNGILGRIARTMVAFNDWRHQDLFDIIFNDWFFENYGRGGNGHSPLVEGDGQS